MAGGCAQGEHMLDIIIYLYLNSFCLTQKRLFPWQPTTTMPEGRWPWATPLERLTPQGSCPCSLQAQSLLK